MIFVTTGTVSMPFKRLVDEMMEISKKEHLSDVFIQSGTYLMEERKNAQVQNYYPFKQMIYFFKHADVIVAAAGESTVCLALTLARGRIIFVPRLKQYKEHVDDQQLYVAQAIKKQGFAEVVLNIDNLKKALKNSQPRYKRYQEQGRELKKLTGALQDITLRNEPLGCSLFTRLSCRLRPF